MTMEFLVNTKIKVKSSSWCAEYDLLSIENIRKLRVERNCIKNVTMAGAISPNLYPEIGVALPSHPLAGSVCANFEICNGKKYSIDDIWYYDYNLYKTHEMGLEHWNHEIRIVNHTDNKIVDWIKEKTPYHSMKATDEIEITYFENGEEKTKTTKKVDY